MKRIFICIFICLLAFFLMSHNASAIDLTQDVYLIQGNFQFSIAPWSWTCYNDSSCPTWSSGVYQRSFSSFGANITDISISIPNRSYIADDWIVFDFYFFHSNTAANHSIFDGIKYAGNNPVDVVDVQFEQLTDNSAHATVYLRAWGSFTDSNLRFVGNATLFQLQSAANAQYKAQVDAGIMTIWHARSGADYSQTLNNINNSINNMPSAEDNAEAMADEEEQRTQDVVDQAEQDAQDSQDDVDQATASLLAVGGQVVNVIINTAATNCNLPMKFTHYDMGVVNLCSGMPTNVLDIIRGVSALVFIPVIVNYALYLVNKLVSLYRSFQG